jgi:hypothetical protein
MLFKEIIAVYSEAHKNSFIQNTALRNKVAVTYNHRQTWNMSETKSLTCCTHTTLGFWSLFKTQQHFTNAIQRPGTAAEYSSNDYD